MITLFLLTFLTSEKKTKENLIITDKIKVKADKKSIIPFRVFVYSEKRGWEKNSYIIDFDKSEIDLSSIALKGIKCSKLNPNGKKIIIFLFLKSGNDLVRL